MRIDSYANPAHPSSPEYQVTIRPSKSSKCHCRQYSIECLNADNATR